MNCIALAVYGIKHVLGIVLLTIPTVVVTPEFGRGFYHPLGDTKCIAFDEDYICRKFDPGNAIVYVREIDDCYAITHEFIHHAQYQVTGRMPATKSEMYLAETEASRLTQYVMDNVGGGK